MGQERKTDNRGAAEASRYLGVGLTWAVAVGLFTWLGVRADAWLGTEPWLTLVGAFTGAVAGFWYMYRHLVIEPRERERKGKGR